jgi:hypothetical protein
MPQRHPQVMRRLSAAHDVSGNPDSRDPQDAIADLQQIGCGGETPSATGILRATVPGRALYKTLGWTVARPLSSFAYKRASTTTSQGLIHPPASGTRHAIRAEAAYTALAEPSSRDGKTAKVESSEET